MSSLQRARKVQRFKKRLIIKQGIWYSADNRSCYNVCICAHFSCRVNLVLEIINLIQFQTQNNPCLGWFILRATTVSLLCGCKKCSDLWFIFVPIECPETVCKCPRSACQCLRLQLRKNPEVARLSDLKFWVLQRATINNKLMLPIIYKQFWKIICLPGSGTRCSIIRPSADCSLAMAGPNLKETKYTRQLAWRPCFHGVNICRMGLVR